MKNTMIKFVKDLVSNYEDSGFQIKSVKHNPNKKESIIEFEKVFNIEQKDLFVRLGRGRTDSANFSWDGNKLIIAWNI